MRDRESVIVNATGEEVLVSFFVTNCATSQMLKVRNPEKYQEGCVIVRFGHKNERVFKAHEVTAVDRMKPDRWPEKQKED